MSKKPEHDSNELAFCKAITLCEACPWSLICLMGTLHHQFRVVRMCPRCGLARMVKHGNSYTDHSADADVAEQPFVYCHKRQLTRRQRGNWKTACTKFLTSFGTGRVNDIRDVFITVPDPEQPQAPYGMMVLLCDECYILSLEGASVPKGMGTAHPNEFYGWCPD